MKHLLLGLMAILICSCSTNKSKEVVLEENRNTIEYAVSKYMNDCLVNVEKPSFEKIEPNKLLIQFDYVEKFTECVAYINNLINQELKSPPMGGDMSPEQEADHLKRMRREHGKGHPPVPSQKNKFKKK